MVFNMGGISLAFCSNCGSQVNEGAEFCKNCGKDLKTSNKNFFSRINEKINIFGVYVGLAISLLVLLVASALYGSLVATGKLDIIGFAYLVLLSMMFIGGFVTSILSCKTYLEGFVNGGFLGLVSLINFGFIIGILWLAAMAVIGTMANAFNSFGGTSSTPDYIDTSSSGSSIPSISTTPGDILPLVEIVLLPFLIVLLGMAGGYFGVFVKKLLNKA